MKRKVILSKNAILWSGGDSAASIAVVESGKLAARMDGKLVGLIWPKMVLGESAILTLSGVIQERTATVIALEDDTTVGEYPAEMVKQSFLDGNHSVSSAILNSLVGQICRNCLLIITANRELPLLQLPFRGLLEGFFGSFNQQMKSIHSWHDFMTAFDVLFHTRDHTGLMRERLVTTGVDAEAISRAQKMISEIVKSEDSIASLDDYLEAEAERTSWLVPLGGSSGAGNDPPFPGKPESGE